MVSFTPEGEIKITQIFSYTGKIIQENFIEFKDTDTNWRAIFDLRDLETIVHAWKVDK